MKTITIPINLLKLPYPWNLTSFSERRKRLKVLNINEKAIKNALMVLECSLLFLSQNTFIEGESIPEDMREYWDMAAEGISSKILTIDEFNLTKIEEDLHLNNIDFPSETMIEETAQRWIWTIVRNLARGSIAWLEEAMKNGQDSKLVDKYLAIASCYWQSSIPDALAVSLIGAGNRIAGERAIPLLEEVQKNSQDRELAKMAKSYKRLMVNPDYG